MGKDQLVYQAEREVLAAAKAWGDSRPWRQRALAAEEEKLKYALYMLERARHLSGKVELP